MGCAISANEPDVVDWEELPCDAGVKAWLRQSGVTLKTAERLVKGLGLVSEGDKLLLTQEMLKALNLPAIERAKVLKMFTQAGPDTPAPTSPCKPPSAALAEGPLSPAEQGGGDSSCKLKELLQDKKKLTSMAQQGLGHVSAFLNLVGPLLPFPGGSAAALLSTVACHVSNALANRDNLERLLLRCTDLLGLAVSKADITTTGTCSISGAPPSQAAVLLKRSQAYTSLMTRFVDLLQEIAEYSQQYTGRHFLTRLLTSGVDSAQYAELASQLRDLTVDATFAVGVEGVALTSQVQTQVQQLAADLDRRLAYVVLEDPVLLQQALAKADLAHQLTAQLMQSALLSLKASMEAATHKRFHRHIRQPDLRDFWFHTFSGEWQVPWPQWWAEFPDSLSDLLSPEAYKQLCACLAPPEAQAAFRQAVERYDPSVISVDELQLSFPADQPLADRVAVLVQQAAEAAATLSAAASSGPDSLATNPAAGTAAPTTASSPGLGTPCRLPQLDPLYQGREGVRQQVAALLGGHRAVLLLGSGGSGKSSLALDVAWSMWRGGQLPGGAFLVDLRSAELAQAQEQRLCAALDIAYDDTAVVRLLIKVASSGVLLLVVDNAEDCLLGGDAAPFAALLNKVLACCPAALLLITSRAPWPTTKQPSGAGLQPTAIELASACTGPVTQPQPVPAPAVVEAAGAVQSDPAVPALLSYHELLVPPLDNAAMTALVAAVSGPDMLTPAEAALVAAACQGSPLLARLVADACASGRLTSEDVEATAGGGSSVALTLMSLPARQQRQLVQLSVFPASFDEEAAAAVLGVPGAGPRRSLYSHGLLLSDSRSGRMYLHMAVRQQAADMATACVLQPAHQAFTHYFLGQLEGWAAMYHSPAFPLALQLMRAHLVDLQQVWRLASQGSGVLLEAVVACVTTSAVWALLVDACATEGLAAALAQLGPEDACAAQARGMLAMEGGEPVEAERWLRAAVRLFGERWGKADLRTLQAARSLGWCLSYQGQCAEAEALLRQVVEGQAGVLAPDHYNALMAANALASCLDDMGQYAAAEAMFREVLAAQRGKLGQEHPNTVDSMNNLAVCLSNAGYNAASVELLRQVYATRQHVLGPEHPETLSSMNNLAYGLSDLGLYAEAERLYRQALEAQQALLGQEHPDTLRSIWNLANCLSEQGHHADAESLHRQGLLVRQRVLGPEHPETLESMQRLACCMDEQQRSLEAEALHREVVATWGRLLGDDHPDTLTSRQGLAACLQLQHQQVAAETMYREALQAQQRCLGQEHPKTLTTTWRLATCLEQQGRMAAAEELYRRALDAQMCRMGAEHPHTLRTMSCLAGCLEQQGRALAARDMFSRTGKALQRVLGEHHPLTLATLAGLQAQEDTRPKVEV